MKVAHALALITLSHIVIQCSSAPSVVLFGDSLSDNGNGYAGNAKFILRTNQTYPQEPYYNGRWSNGPTWIEVAASLLGASLTDYGAGGATTGIVPAQVPPLPVGFAGLTVPTTVLSPTIPQQLNAHFLKTNSTLSASPLYFIFVGANDYFSIVFQNTTVTAEAVTGYIQDAMLTLYTKGARKFVLVEEPDLSGIPVFTQAVYGSYPASAVQRMAAQVTQHNKLLQQLSTSFPGNNSGSSVYVYDFGAAFSKVLNNATLGFTNTKQACYLTVPDLAQNSQPDAQPIGLAAGGTLCSDPDAHVFWDQFHPTRVIHKGIGELFVQQTGKVLFGVPSQ